MTQPQNPFPDYAHGPYASNAPALPTSVKVLAIIGIILGGLGVLCTPVNLMPYVVQKPGAPNPLVDEVKKDPNLVAWTVGSGVFGWVMCVVLLVGSVGSLSLKPWARSLMLTYGWTGIVLGVIGMVINCMWMMPAMSRAAGATRNLNLAMYGGTCAVIGGVIGMIFPLCILFFFTRPHVTAAFAKEQA